MKIDKEDTKLIARLLTPSFFSGTVAVLAGLVVTLGVIVAFATSNSTIQQELVGWQSESTEHERILTTPDQVLVVNDHPTLQGSWPLLIVWSLVGLLVYVIAISIVHSIQDTEELIEETEYVNAKPHLQVEEAVEHLVLRLISGAIFVSLLVLLFKQVLPYSITAAHASTAAILSLNGALYALLSFSIVVVTIHIQTIFLRLTTGRVRVF